MGAKGYLLGLLPLPNGKIGVLDWQIWQSDRPSGPKSGVEVDHLLLKEV